MASLSGDESPMPPTTYRNGEQVGSGLVNGSLGVSSGQLTSEIRNLVSIFGRQSDNGISLEQLLTGNSPNRNSVVTPTQTLSHPFPTTPSSSKSTGWPTRKRGRPFEAEESSKRRRSGSYSARQATSDKGHSGKGLRHFSQRVCEKVRQKGNTTYNEVADELVKELSETERKSHGSNDSIDHKNIRRRVYDALNVLMAMNIISKEKKDIRWIGLPTNSIQECHHIEEELAQAEQRISNKRGKVEDLIVQILSYKNLMKRNRERVSSLGTPAQNSAIGLPFIIVNTSKTTTIDCSISSDKSEYVFSFDNAFELHNDIDVLKKMGLDCGLHSGSCSVESLKHAKAMLPKAFGDVLDEIAVSKSTPAIDSFPDTPTANPPPSSHSTPSTTVMSPSLTPFTTPTASPHSVSLAAFLAQVQHSPQSGSPVGGGYTSPIRPAITPAITPANSTNVAVSPCAVIPNGPALSPQGAPASSLRGKHVLPVAAKQPSVSAAKAVLHQRCPSNQPECASPLTKSSFATSESVANVQSSPQASSSSVTSKSPSAKFVTVSILQQLQQNPSISKLLSAANLHQSNGNGM